VPDGTALIVGAGIGGLAAATSLRRRGWSVRIYERAQGPGDLGFGLALAANAMSALGELGVADAVRTAGCVPRRGELCGEHGRVLKRIEAQMAGPLVGAISIVISCASRARVSNRRKSPARARMVTA
jgi:2-polyprenyl-6-methoxyphenol hydroxylase-like FAD-dependent oxidoreductase